MTEFEKLFSILHTSGCAKKQTAAGTYVKGTRAWFYAVNHCNFEGESCPRLTLPSGTGYELCDSKHAEANLMKLLSEHGFESDGILWIVGRYWMCEPCASVSKKMGVKEIRIMELPI